MSNGETTIDADTGLVTTQDLMADSQQVGQVAQVFAETQAAVLLAKKFPRVYNVAWGKLQEMCARKTLAEKAEYKYPRGKKQVKGPSVYIARPIAQCWGNIHFGFKIIAQTEDDLTLQGYAWDLESNTKIFPEMTIKKLIYRKDKGWIKPDERDLQELINRIGAKLIRNAILQIVPTDFVEDAVASCRQTLLKGLKDPKSATKQLILAFQDFNVNVDALNRYVGSKEWTGDDIVDLQGVLNAIKDGEAKPRDYFAPPSQEPTKNRMDTKKMKVGDKEKHQSVKGRTTKAKKKAPAKKAEAKKGAEPPKVDPDVTGKQIDEIRGLVKANESVLSDGLLKKCTEDNLAQMSPEGRNVVQEIIKEEIETAEKAHTAATK